jgi:4,5-dihydroxyphthalate decarboxylase
VTYLLSKRYLKQFTAIPVFVARGFHHHNVVSNPRSGIKEPKDLEGKRLGIRAYTVTANIWFTGMLQKEYGVDPSKITFVTDDEDHVQEFELPPNVVKVGQGQSLALLWADGQLDAAFLANAGIGRAGAPVGDWAANDAVQKASQVTGVPLFPNAREAELEWYRRTGVLPIHGVIVVRNSTLVSHPWIAPELFRAFKEARRIYLERLAAEGQKYPDDKSVLQLSEMLGQDAGALPMGFERNRKSLEAWTEYAYGMGYTTVKYDPEEVFVPNTLDLD